jgi:ankyrin repeat protein
MTPEQIQAVDGKQRTILHRAVQIRSDLIELLLKHDGVKALLEIRDKEGYTPLHRAILHRDDVIIKVLLKFGASVLAKTLDQRTVLHLAASKNAVDWITQFSRIRGMDVNAKDTSGKTALHYAAAHISARGDPLAAFKKLLEIPEVDETIRDNDNKTASLCVDYNFYSVSQNARSAYRDSVRCELMKRADPGQKNAVSRIAKLLAEPLIDPEYDRSKFKILAEANGGTILHLAVQWGYFEKLQEFLLMLGFTHPFEEAVLVRDNTGRSALHLAAQRGDIPAIGLFLWVAERPVMGHNKSVINALLSMKDRSNQTALHLAAEAGQVDATLMLLCYMTPEQVAVEDEAGKTAEALATERGHDDIIPICQDFSSHGHGSILIIAVNKDRVPLVKRLLQMPGIDVNARGSLQGQTALHRAATFNRLECVQALLNVDRIDITIVDTSNQRRTALHIATQRGREEIVGALLAKGTGLRDAAANTFRADVENVVNIFRESRKAIVDLLNQFLIDHPVRR